MFASNYIDRELRKDQANHHRETVCFTRNIANGLSRLACYIAYHNYFKPFRISSKLRLAATHAEAAGIDPDRVIQLSRTMFEERAFLSRIRLSPPLDRMWRKLAATPCTSGVVYLPHYAIA